MEVAAPGVGCRILVIQSLRILVLRRVWLKSFVQLVQVIVEMRETLERSEVLRTFQVLPCFHEVEGFGPYWMIKAK